MSALLRQYNSPKKWKNPEMSPNKAESAKDLHAQKLKHNAINKYSGS